MFEKQKSSQIQNLKALAGSISHETRNSLSAIKGCCEIVKNNLTEIQNNQDNLAQVQNNLNEAMEFLDLIFITSTRGLMISEMILANIREEKIDSSKFVDLSMSDIVKSAIREFAFGSEEERQLVNFDLNLNSQNDFVFKGDETMMIFLLFNLLKNSLYYKAKINIWLERDKKDDEGKTFNYLYFKDNGVGIPSDKLELIFDDFFTSGKKGGTGLGLPFCKRVMKAFGGDIACKSKQGQFTEFVLKFSKWSYPLEASKTANSDIT